MDEALAPAFVANNFRLQPMLLLPKTVGPITLVRKMGTGGVAESYQGTLQGSRVRNVIVRRVLPYLLNDEARLQELELRVRDLLGLDHPNLVRMVEWVVDQGERYIVEECVDGIDLARLLKWCSSNNAQLPANVFLSLATQICNGLEALHATAGRGTQASSVLHLGLKPTSIFVNSEGQVLLGGYGLSRSPTLLPQGGSGGSPVPFRMEYLSPEQTHGEARLGPPSDIFSLGAILFELLTLQPLFRADTSLLTIDRIRRGEITSQLLQVREIMPGLDKVLYRALSLSSRHRYQRAFVMREDLRALMSNYSFSSIANDTRQYLGPLFRGSGTAVTGLGEETTGSLHAITEEEPAPDHTMARIERAQEEGAAPAGLVDDAPDAPAGQDDFEDEIATRLKDVVAPLSAPLPLSWDAEPPTAETTSEISVELTLETPSGHSVFEPTEAEVEPSIPEEKAPPSRALRQALARPPGQDRPGPRTVAQVKPPNVEEAVDTQQQHREANTALRNIRAAARSTSESDDSAIYEWKQRQSSKVTAVSVVAGILLICSCAGAVFVALGQMGLKGDVADQDERPTSETEDAGDDRLRDEPVPDVDGSPPLSEADSEAVASSAASAEAEEEPADLTPSQAPALPEADRSTRADVRSTPPHRASSPGTSRSRSTSEASHNSYARSSAASDEPSHLGSYEVSEDAIVSSVLDSPEEFEGDTRIDLDWDYYASRSEQGNLSPSDQIGLEAVPSSDEEAFTRSRALLLMNSQRNQDERATKLYLQQLFLIPTNQYNPVYLTAQAQLQVNQHRYEAALLSASKAERYWQNIPSALITEKLAEIYEVKARSHQGLFYQSEDLDDLDEALLAWSSYREHVAKHSRRDQLAIADRELDKLRDTRARME